MEEEEFDNATLQEIKARWDPNFVPEGWLDPQTPPKKKLKLSIMALQQICWDGVTRHQLVSLVYPGIEYSLCPNTGAANLLAFGAGSSLADAVFFLVER